MQSVEDDDGEFRMYQGVWRLQPLPGCAPKSSRGLSAMRLTYAVEGMCNKMYFGIGYIVDLILCLTTIIYYQQQFHPEPIYRYNSLKAVLPKIW